MRILNLCGHALHFYHRESCDTITLEGRPRLVAREGAHPFLAIPTSGALNVTEHTVHIGMAGEVPDHRVVLRPRGATLPVEREDTVIVVSVKAFAALGIRADLRTIHGAVHDASGRTIGCLGIGRVETAVD